MAFLGGSHLPPLPPPRYCFPGEAFTSFADSQYASDFQAPPGMVHHLSNSGDYTRRQDSPFSSSNLSPLGEDWNYQCFSQAMYDIGFMSSSSSSSSSPSMQSPSMQTPSPLPLYDIGIMPSSSSSSSPFMQTPSPSPLYDIGFMPSSSSYSPSPPLPPPSVIKKKLGRPRKKKVTDNNNGLSSESATSSSSSCTISDNSKPPLPPTPLIKKKLGRPRKQHVSVNNNVVSVSPPLPKRGRGRPKGSGKLQLLAQQGVGVKPLTNESPPIQSSTESDKTPPEAAAMTGSYDGSSRSMESRSDNSLADFDFELNDDTLSLLYDL
ncbi:unnamed protein product [Cochlearia groenlandica]